MNKHVGHHHHHHGKTLAAVPATITVTIFEGPKFELSSDVIPIQPMGDDYLLTFNNSEDGNPGDGFDLTFSIDDRTGLGYGFFQDPNKPSPYDALSAKVNDSSGHCPKNGAKWPGFKPTAVSADRLELHVSNSNKWLQYFGFALHFSLPGENAASQTFDPIGDNQDGESFAGF
jgi:hypothetical protein